MDQGGVEIGAAAPGTTLPTLDARNQIPRDVDEVTAACLVEGHEPLSRRRDEPTAVGDQPGDPYTL